LQGGEEREGEGKGGGGGKGRRGKWRGSEFSSPIKQLIIIPMPKGR